jgi:exonuclease III
MYLTDIYRVFHPGVAQYTFFSAANVTFSKVDHILGHKESLNKYKKVGISPSILSDHKRIKLELNYSNKKLLKIFKHMEIEQHAVK